MNSSLTQNVLEDDIYSNDDLSCFNNLQWEMTELLEYLKDCNLRKITYFKIALGILSVFVTGFGLVINTAVQKSPIIKSLAFQSLVSFSLIIMGLLTYTVIRELYSIHSSRVITLRQMNCLRQSVDSIRFKKHEGRYPTEINELQTKNTNYWKYFGQHRKLPVDNHSLRKVEMSKSRSPDVFMILILFGISFSLQVMGVLYLAYGAAFNVMGGVFIGSFLTATTWYFISDFIKSRKQLMSALGIER